MIMLTGKRTDLALESANSVDLGGELPEGIKVFERKTEGFLITEVEVITPEAAERIGKPVGRYITLETGSRLDMRPENFESCAKELAAEIASLVGKGGSVMIAGLGNEDITPDSLGPRVCSHIFATRHIRENAPELITDGIGEVSSVAPGVMGQTGIEAG